jgi:hypothetical protein
MAVGIGIYGPQHLKLAIFLIAERLDGTCVDHTLSYKQRKHVRSTSNLLVSEGHGDGILGNNSFSGRRVC